MKELSNKSANLAGSSSSSIVQMGRLSSNASTFGRTGAISQAVLLNPVIGGAIVGMTGIGIYGIGNLVNYAKKNKTGKQALGDTLKESGGLGVSAGLGILAGNAVVDAGVVLGSSFVLPLVAGVTVTYIAKRLWNRLVCGRK